MCGSENGGSAAWAPPKSDPKRYRILFDTAPVMYHSLDCSGRIIECNSTECRTLGYKWSELVGKHITEILSPEDALRWPKDFDDLLEHGSLHGLQRRLRRRDGAIVEVLVDVAVEYGPDGRPAYTKAVFVDVTERKRLEKALSDSLHQLETVFHGIRDLLILHDTELRIVRINRFALDRLGLSEEDALGRPCYQVYHGAAEVCPGCPVERALREGKETHGEATSPRGLFDVHAYPVYDEAGAVRGVVEYAREIGAERRLRAEALQSERLRTLGQLAGGVAHDFNNLLGAIQGYASTLVVEETDDERRTALKGILAASQRAADLTRHLLSFARETGGEEKPVELNRVVSEVAALLDRTVDASVQVRTEIDPDGPVVTGDASALYNAVLNLGLNARDAMPAGGTMTLATRRAAVPDRPPGVEAPAGTETFAAVEVRDTGTGIPPEIRGRIFEPFFSTKGDGGTGLGLSTVFGIAQAHRGRVEFQTEEGKGTTFRLLLPRAGTAAPQSGEAAAPADASVRPAKRSSLAPVILGRPPRVAVIEDEAFVRMSLVRILRKLGYDVQPARNGAEALATIAAVGPDRVDVVLLDVTMPDMAAEQVFERLREIGVRAPVVLMSGGVRDDRVDRLIGQGAVAFIPKPFDISTLGEELAGVIVADRGPSGSSGGTD